MLAANSPTAPVSLSGSDPAPPAPATWLLLRGLGRERGHWFEFARLLERSLGAQVVPIDLPGNGQRRHEPVPSSIAALARRLAAELRAGPAGPPRGVLGISLGGMVALSLAEQWPSGISHVVVVNTSSRLSCGHQRLRPRAALSLLRASMATEPEARERLIYSLTTSAPGQDVARWAQEAAAVARRVPPSRRALLAQLYAAATFRAPAHIPQPALVLSGARDRLVSPACSAALARALGATLRCHPGAGHDLPLEQPRWVIEQLKAWLAASACEPSD